MCSKLWCVVAVLPKTFTAQCTGVCDTRNCRDEKGPEWKTRDKNGRKLRKRVVWTENIKTSAIGCAYKSSDHKGPVTSMPAMNTRHRIIHDMWHHMTFINESTHTKFPTLQLLQLHREHFPLIIFYRVLTHHLFTTPRNYTTLFNR